MRTIITILLGLLIGGVLAAQEPATSELYKTIVSLDKKYFDAYDTCDLETQASLISEDIRFYHDMGGLETSKDRLIQSIKENVCGTTTRHLTEGSLEVYRIPNYGAILLGRHGFKNNREPDAPFKDAKFVGIWKQTAGSWQMTEVISLH